MRTLELEPGDHLSLKIITWILCTLLLGAFITQLFIQDQDKARGRRMRFPQRREVRLRRKIEHEEMEVVYE